MQQVALAQTCDITILSHSGPESLMAVKIWGNSPVFEGHFPGNPILPGVVMVEAVRASLCQLFQKEYWLKSALHIKFLAVLNPEEYTVVHLRIRHSEVEDGLKVEANLLWKEKIFFKMKGNYSSV